MSNIDWSQLITKTMKDDELVKAQMIIGDVRETLWKEGVMRVITDQLIALEDDDPDRMPVTEQEWRAYRTQIRAWKLGAMGYPAIENRPAKPEGASFEIE